MSVKTDFHKGEKPTTTKKDHKKQSILIHCLTFLRPETQRINTFFVLMDC